MDIGEFSKDDIRFAIGSDDIAESGISDPVHGRQANDWLRKSFPKRSRHDHDLKKMMIECSSGGTEKNKAFRLIICSFSPIG